MSLAHSLKRASFPLVFILLSIMGLALATSIRPASAVPAGTYFDHIVIIAMENTPYASVFGTGTVASCPTGSAPFLCSMLPLSATMPYLNNYGATAADGNDFNGCSAACYVGLLAGYTYGVADGYGSLSASNLVADRLAPAGLTWQAYCAEGCPRGNDHFPFTSFTDTSSSSNIFSSSSVTTATLVSAANSASPPNFLWYTPTDSENMHDVSVSAGDSYLQSFLVGSGSVAAPASGSLLASNLFTNPSFHTVLYLWWDECGGGNGSCDSNNAVPNLLYGSTVKKGYVSSDLTGMDEYASLWTIESNWGLAPLAQGDTAAKTNGYLFNDVFGSIGPLPLSASFHFLPTGPIARSLVSFTGLGVGGAPPYTYAWTFGDGSTGTGVTVTHTYASSGSYNVTLTITDSASKSAKSSQILQISPIPTLSASFAYSPTSPTSGQSVAFSGSGSGGASPYTYSWNFGDGGSSPSQSPSHTYTASGSFTVKFNVTDTLGTVATSSQSITVSPPGALTASFTISPASPASGQSVTFTGTASGGTGPDSYSWNLGGTSTTGNPVSHSFTNGTYTIRLTVNDSASKTATSSQTLTVLPPSTGGRVPVLVGWGGVRMDESVAGSSGTLSAVFQGEYASDMELLLIQLKAMGYNTVRVDFDPYCTDTADFNYMSVYSQTNAQRAVQIAQHYGFWIILDYHGYSDIFRNTSCWLSYWKPIVQNIGPLYSQIIWEPQNEPTLDCTNSPSSCPAAPCSSDATCVTYLSTAYQQWINQTRLLGDTHWIVIQNLCSYACGFTDMSQGYPTVTDTLGTASSGGKVFISLHSYMDYGQNSGSWTNSTAVSVANQYYQAVVSGVANTGWPALNTEGGTDPLCSSCAPDTVLSGSAGYTVVTFHFIQTLVNLYDANSPQRINWVWWPVGSWTNTPAAGTYGAVECNSNPIGWGCILTFKPVGPPSSDFTISASSPNAVDVGQSAQSTITIAPQNGSTGTVSLTDVVTAGLSCGNISPATITASSSASVTCSATNAGSYVVTIIATSGSLVHSTSSVFNFQDFSITASSPVAVPPGSSATSTITVSALNGFTSAVALSVKAPSGLSCGSLSHNSVGGSGTATLSCNSANQNVYAVTVTATSGSLTHTATATFTFGVPPDFTITATQPTPGNVGSSQKSTITIALLNGLAGTVALTTSKASGISCGLITPTSLNANGTATISCTSQSASSYTLTITGTSGSLTHTATVIFAFLDFSLTANPSSLSINSGGQGTASIGLNLLNGFSGSVSLSVASPNGVSTLLDTNSISGLSTATLTVNPTTGGSYSIVVSGTSGSLTRTVAISVTVGIPSSLTLNAPSTVVVVQTSRITFSVNATDSSTMSTLTLSASALPSGARFANAQGTSQVSSTFAWTPTTNDAAGTYTVSFSVTNGFASAQTYVVITVVAAGVLPIINTPGPQNATIGSGLHFTISASDPTGTGGTVLLSATGLVSDMAFDSSTGSFTFTPSSSQAGRTYIVNFTATDSNNPSYTKTQSVPIHVQGNAATPSGGGFCLSCLLPKDMTTTAWLVAIGALIGIASSIAILHIRASSELSAAKKRMRDQNSGNVRETYHGRRIQQRVQQRPRRKLDVEDD